MKRMIALTAFGAAALTGCAAPENTVLFVTNTSLGMNAESKLPTVSIAYDRTEGYLGPRAENGEMPPVVASLQTNGAVFGPKVKQTYATGNAAILAVSQESVPTTATPMTGGKNEIAFFGTSTTVGLKVGFSETGSPDSVLFGYKRREASIIPLGKKDNTLVYPSVVAAIDIDGSIGEAKKTGLAISQFMATGRAAEYMAAKPLVRNSFGAISDSAVLSTLTPEQQATAKANAVQLGAATDAAIAKIETAVAPGGTLDKTKLADLIAKANTARPGSVNTSLSGVADFAALRSVLSLNAPTADSLAKAADGQ